MRAQTINNVGLKLEAEVDESDVLAINIALTEEQAKDLLYNLSQMNWNGLIENNEVPCSNNAEMKSFEEARHVLFDQIIAQI